MFLRVSNVSKMGSHIALVSYTVISLDNLLFFFLWNL